MLRALDPDYRVWGSYDGRGLVIRSPEPVEFHSLGGAGGMVQGLSHDGFYQLHRLMRWVNDE